uniref:DJ-1/PfpI domain-containing protein n=1 Tax=Aegilops tauschii TaxID=37682 RepID=M8BA91_AEGTA
MAPSKKVLMLCGDYMEDYEAAVPFYALAGLGVAVHCAAPGKAPGDPCLTAVHDFLGYELYTELPGHRFRPEGAVADGKLVTAASWPDLAEFIAHLVDLLGITVSF